MTSAASPLRMPNRPIQMFVQKGERAHAVDRVGTVKKFDFSPIAQPQFVVVPADFGVLPGDPLIRRDAVVMSPFDHERPWRH